MQEKLSLVHSVRPAAPGTNGAGVRPPLLLLLHGVGANERQMTAIAPAFDPRLVVASVRSPLTMGPDAFGWFHVAFTANGPVIAEDEASDAWVRIARFAGEAVRAYHADPMRVYVGGFSQGGIISLTALLTAPEQFAGAFCMSGRLLPEVLPHVAGDQLVDKPVLVVHGEYDSKLGVHLARWARTQLEQLHIDLTYRELPIGHEITRESVSEVSTWLTAQLEGADGAGRDDATPVGGV
jgi:phospholipase/carboxylesterase